MKKLSLILIALLVFLVGCGNGENTPTTSKENKGYVFETENITIAMHEKVEPILKSLGDAKDYFEADSCAFQGKEKVYTYNGFEIHTYEKDKVDYVAAVIFLDDSVSTKEGISLNDDLEAVKAAYGDKFTEKLGQYTYELDKSKISFLIEDNKVTSIEYMGLME